MSPYIAPRRWASAPVIGLFSVLVVACGGGGSDGGGDGGGAETGGTVHLLVTNKSDADITVQYTGAEPAAEAPLEACTALLEDYPLADPFTVSIDGAVAFDSATLPEGLPNQGQGGIVLEITVDKEGTVSAKDPTPGRGIARPSRSAICPSLPG
jgi:hypothetical protein